MELVELSPSRYDALFGGEHGGSTGPPPGLDLPPPPPSPRSAPRNPPGTAIAGGPVRAVWVPQGGACGIATGGAAVLAREVVEYWARNGEGRPLSVCVPGGTCTTAVLLGREIRSLLEGRDDSFWIDIDVVVVPCVGGAGYARRQMTALDLALGGGGLSIPAVLGPGNLPDGGRDRYFPFAEPHADILRTYEEMQERHGLFLDLLYGAPSWNLLLRHLEASSPPAGSGEEPPGGGEADRDRDRGALPLEGREVMYVHSGGLERVSSQLTRYRHKGLVDPRTVQ